MIFISLCKVRKKLTKESIAEATKVIQRATKEGVKFLNIYYTLGRYDIVVIFEAPDEKIAMKMAIMVGDIESTETLVAVPREEAMKLVE
ncbi:MAG: GYD domain-containing protein [archaeon]|nr:GYD domain-containing protein [archaeon]